MPCYRRSRPDMAFISGSTYTLDSYRQACIAIAQAEKSATVHDLREPTTGEK